MPASHAPFSTTPDWDHVAPRLAAVGYAPAMPPMRIETLASYVAGRPVTEVATPLPLYDCGNAIMVARERADDGWAVLRIAPVGDFFGRLNERLYIAGLKADRYGHLYYSELASVLCPDGTTVAAAAELLRAIFERGPGCDVAAVADPPAPDGGLFHIKTETTT